MYFIPIVHLFLVQGMAGEEAGEEAEEEARSSPVYAYCKRSKTGQWESLGTRLLHEDTHTHNHTDNHTDNYM